MTQAQEYVVLPQRYLKKTKSGIHCLAPRHFVKVSRTVKEGENWLDVQGKVLGSPVHKGIKEY
jgi:hypothetical protein